MSAALHRLMRQGHHLGLGRGQETGQGGQGHLHRALDSMFGLGLTMGRLTRLID